MSVGSHAAAAAVAKKKKERRCETELLVCNTPLFAPGRVALAAVVVISRAN